MNEVVNAWYSEFTGSRGVKFIVCDVSILCGMIYKFINM